MNSKVTVARRAAFDVLRRVETEDAYASNLLASSRYDRLSREDHALLLELVLGVLRWQGLLDFFIEHYSRRKLSKLDPEVVIAIRLGLYQLRFLTRVPQHAAINESVNLVKEQKKQSAAPLVNAVLRAAQRDGDSDGFNHGDHGGHGEDKTRQSPRDPRDPRGSSLPPAIITSHPPWLIERWTGRFGEDEARALAMANNSSPRTAFRFNTIRASEEQTRSWFDQNGIRIERSELAPQAWVIESGNLSARSEPVEQGWVYLQDEASQLVAHLSESSLKFQIEHFKSLDLCAAPGSKTTLIASLLPENALIVATDLRLNRLRVMKELCRRQGIENIGLVQLDATLALPFPQFGSFDSVLLDAPCSGLGTLQRRPEIKWRMSIAKIREMAELQKRLLANAAQQVRAGGMITYSVCSTEPEEGEEVIASFKKDHPEFRDMTRERSIEIGLDPAPLLTSSFGARTFTHRQGSESFFICVLWKRR